MNLKIFKENLILFYSSWQENKRNFWGNSDILVMCTPPSDTSPNPSHPISSSFFYWLLGHEIHDTIAVFTKDEIYFICTEERFLILKNLEETAMLAVQATIKVILKNTFETGFKTMDNIVNWIRDTEKAWAAADDEIGPLVIGYVCNESPSSDLLLSCAFSLQKNEFLSTRVPGFSQLLTQHGDKPSAEDIQIINSREEDEQMFLPTTERKEEKTTESHDEHLSSDGGGAALSSTALMYDIAEIASHARVSSAYSLESDEEDEWVLVED